MVENNIKHEMLYAAQRTWQNEGKNLNTGEGFACNFFFAYKNRIEPKRQQHGAREIDGGTEKSEKAEKN